MILAAPRPAIARPTMSAVEVGATPHMRAKLEDREGEQEDEFDVEMRIELSN